IALAMSAGRDARPCDTWVALPDVTASGVSILAKNSDRPVFDCQPLFFHPRQTWSPGAVIDLGRTTIPQVRETYATIGSSPYWCWGYEEGMNEFGVAIGNEGIWTRVLARDVAAAQAGGGPELGPTGMDLLRLGLERGRTARQALEVITSLLETHGQFGSGIPTMGVADGGYHNSYIIADPREAWVLETAGRHWVARRLAGGSTSISNTPSIDAQWDLASSSLVQEAVNEGWWPAERTDALDFSLAYGDDGPVGQARRAGAMPRAACSSRLLEERHGSVTPRWMMRIARDESSTPPINLDVTASSCVAVLPQSQDELPVFWWCPAVPGDSCYVPFFVHGSGLPAIVSVAGTQGRSVRPPSSVEADTLDPDSLWWTFRDLHDRASGSMEDRTPELRAVFDALEKDFEQGLPEVIERAVSLRRAGQADDAAAVLDAYSAACLDRAVAAANELRAAIGAEPSASVPPSLQPYLGRYYATYKEETHTVVIREGRLAIDVPGQMVYELLDPDESGRRQFALTDKVAVSFVHAASGEVLGLTYHQGGLDLELLREGYVPPAEIEADEAAAWLGRYRFAPAGLNATVLIHHGRLAVDVTGQMIFVLRRSDDEGVWVARATDQITVTFETGDDDTVPSMTMRQSGQPVVFQRVTEGEGDG
ncbi:MAG: C69 family dipeptidase, partial [Planctomycetota bacterium]